MSRSRRIAITEPLLRKEIMNTQYGTLTGEEWLEKEKERVNTANSRRNAKVRPYKGKVRLIANEPQNGESKEW